MLPKKETLWKAYEIGKGRGSALSLDYYHNGHDVFVQMPNSLGGIVVKENGDTDYSWEDVPDGFVRFDMYEARN